MVEIAKRHCHDIPKNLAHHCNSQTRDQLANQGQHESHCSLYLSKRNRPQPDPYGHATNAIFKRLQLTLHSARTLPDPRLDFCLSSVQLSFYMPVILDAKAPFLICIRNTNTHPLNIPIHPLPSRPVPMNMRASVRTCSPISSIIDWKLLVHCVNDEKAMDTPMRQSQLHYSLENKQSQRETEPRAHTCLS